jgi:hypothetical protein
MVFPDVKKDDPYGGSRYFWGIIRDVSGEIVTVEVTRSTWLDFKNGSYLWFRPFQIWTEFREVEQLSLSLQG